MLDCWLAVLRPPSVADLRGIPQADPDTALAALAAGLGWLLAGWVVLGLLLTVLQSVPGRPGRTAAHLAAVITLGLSVALGSAAAAAFADEGGSSIPSLDRPGTPQHLSAYVVRPGDCLWSVARRHLPRRASMGAVARLWPRWYTANRAVIGRDPDLIHPGQRLRAPISTSTRRPT